MQPEREPGELEPDQGRQSVPAAACAASPEYAPTPVDATSSRNRDPEAKAHSAAATASALAPPTAVTPAPRPVPPDSVPAAGAQFPEFDKALRQPSQQSADAAFIALRRANRDVQREIADLYANRLMKSRDPRLTQLRGHMFVVLADIVSAPQATDADKMLFIISVFDGQDQDVAHIVHLASCNYDALHAKVMDRVVSLFHGEMGKIPVVRAIALAITRACV
jgi:hypothetical protein